MSKLHHRTAVGYTNYKNIKKPNCKQAMDLSSALYTKVGNSIEGKSKWYSCVEGSDGCIYGIPSTHRRVAKFDPNNEVLTVIGPELDGEGWSCGVLAGNGCIYCIPCDPSNSGILKIDTMDNLSKATETESVTILDAVLPSSEYAPWLSGALAADGCIYFLPATARNILKLDPSNDTLSLVGREFDQHLIDGVKFRGTIAAKNGYIYGVPDESMHVIRFNPMNQNISYVGEDFSGEYFLCADGGAIGRDGHVYTFCRLYYQVMKIDTEKNLWSLFGNRPDESWRRRAPSSVCAMLGSDGCIYWTPSANLSRTHKFDPKKEILSLIFHDKNAAGLTFSKWGSNTAASFLHSWGEGVSASSNGVLYCIPFDSDQILAIDPYKEYVESLRQKIEQYPNSLGGLFMEIEDDHEHSNYESALTKFGVQGVFQAIDKSIPSRVNYKGASLPSFLVAALCDNSVLDVIYFLLGKNVDCFLASLVQK